MALRRAGAARVSTHASVRRRPRAGRYHDLFPTCFNSRLREEATRLASYHVRKGFCFNSRLREEATALCCSLSCLLSSFNSRLREEATALENDAICSLLFQLTPP